VTDAAVTPSSLRSRVLGGLAWKLASRVVLQLSRFAVGIILARVLAPHDFGLAAMVLVVAGVITLIGDSALGTAVIQRHSLTEDDRSTVFWLSASIGLTFTLIGVAIAGPVASFYGQGSVRGLFAAMSLGFMITSLGTVQSATLVREMNFRALELRQLAAGLSGAATGIVLAVLGAGPWAIVCQQLATSIVSTILLWSFSGWRPSRTFSPGNLKSIVGFTGSVFGQNLLYYGGRNVDNVLIGRYLGAAPLGAYSLAYNVMLMPFHQIGGMVQQVLFPAFSRMQKDPRRIAEIWLRATRLVSAITVPALVGLVVVAPDFVSVLLGPKWHSAVPLIRILAWAGLLQSLQTLNGDIMWSLDRAGTFLRFTIVWFVASIASFVIGLQWGILGLATSYTICCALIEPLNGWLTARVLGVSFARLVSGFWGVAQATGGMAAAVLAVRTGLIGAGLSPAPRLAICVAVGIAVYLPLLAWRAPETVAEVTSVLGQRRVARAAAVPIPQLSTD
jgi:PST family polysaccharide transporter